MVRIGHLCEARASGCRLGFDTFDVVALDASTSCGVNDLELVYGSGRSGSLTGHGAGASVHEGVQHVSFSCFELFAFGEMDPGRVFQTPSASTCSCIVPLSAPGVSSEIATRFSATFVVYCRSYVRDADLLLVAQR